MNRKQNTAKLLEQIRASARRKSPMQKRIQAKHNVISILQPIGIGEGEYSARQLRRDYEALGKPEELVVEISSEGGNVVEGLAIYDYLKSLKAQITTRVVGASLSIATVIGCAGDKREVTPNSTLMIHEASGQAFGTSGEIRKSANLIDKMQSRMVDIYQKTMKVSRAKIESMLKDETWFDATEAIGCGLATSLLPEYSISASYTAPKPKRRTAVKVSAVKQWDALVAKYQKPGESKAKTIRKVVRENPELHTRYLREFNSKQGNRK